MCTYSHIYEFYVVYVQEASCSGELTNEYDDQGEVTGIDIDQGESSKPEMKQEEVSEQGMKEEEEPREPEMEHHQCEEYKSKIWDNAFSNQGAMDLMKLTFITAEKMGSDEVCSDTIRALFNFIEVMVTNENAHSSIGKFKKMVMFIVRELDATSDKFIETSEVFERISKSPEIRDYIKHSVTRTIDLLKEPVVRGRLFKVIKAFADLKRTPKEDGPVKQITRITSAPSRMAKKAMNKVGNFFRRF